MADDGLITVPSQHSVKKTIDRLYAALQSAGMTVFARIDHAAGAEKAGLKLRPTELLIFGSAHAGTPLMQMRQTIGVDLPLKALAWESADGKVWLTYNHPAWLAARHALGPQAGDINALMASALARLSGQAAGA
jgi:uncharacterized protein (DUF302 family)